MTILSTYAAGYPNPYPSDEDEIMALQYVSLHRTHDPQDSSQTWWPHTPDFEAVARRHSMGGRIAGVIDVQSLIRVISQSHNLSVVRWFGHGARQELQFGSRQVLARSNFYELMNISSHFEPNGRIIFYACNAGYDPAFFQEISNRLQITVCGFSAGVRWTLQWSPPTSPPPRRITYRGFLNQDLPEPSICVQPTIPSQRGAGGAKSINSIQGDIEARGISDRGIRDRGI